MEIARHAATANVTQAQRWNGETGRRWISQRDRHAAVRERLTPRLLEGAAIVPGDRVLDVGCGCGEPTVAAARAAGPGGHVLGLDLSAPMLTVARRFAAGSGVANVDFREGDAQTYPLPPAGFDVVISSFGVMFFDDSCAAFGNLRRALRPGGRLAFLSWQDGLRNEVFAIPLRVLRRHGAAVDAATGDDLFADPDRITALLTEAGFADVHVAAVREPARLGSDVADVMSYVRETTRVRDLLARLPDARTVDRVLAATAEQFAARERPDGVWVTAAAWLVTARAPG